MEPGPADTASVNLAQKTRFLRESAGQRSGPGRGGGWHRFCCWLFGLLAGCILTQASPLLASPGQPADRNTVNSRPAVHLPASCFTVNGIPADSLVVEALADTVLVNSTFAGSDSAAADTELAKDSERHSPTKAAWRAAVLPGWGQIYNQKYWKLPLVYGGLGGLGYWVYFNADQHRFYRQAFVAKTDEDAGTIDPLPAFSEASVLQTKEYYRRQLDASVLFTVAFYGLQIVDAVVDAHLFHFDVSNDLSLQWQPWTAPASGAFSGQVSQFSRANRAAFPAQGLQFILTYR